MECHSNLFGPFRLVDVGIMDRAYEGIIDVIKERTEKKGNGINYYEAARIAYTISPSGVETEVTEVNQFSIYKSGSSVFWSSS